MPADKKAPAARTRLTLEERATIVDLWAKGVSQRKIAKTVGTRLFSVARVIKKWRQHHCIEDLPRRHSTHKITPGMMKEIKIALKRGHMHTAADVRRYLAGQHGLSVSLSTVCAALKRNGLRSYTLRTKPGLTRQQKKLRVKHVRAWSKTMTPPMWSRVVFSDETTIQRVGTTVKFTRWLPQETAFGESRMRQVPKRGGGSISLWAAIGVDGILAHEFLSGRLTGAGYADILKRHIPNNIKPKLKKIRFVWQQDNAPVHTAKSATATLKKLAKKYKFDVLQWPAYSPDLSLIETFWGEMKRRIERVSMEKGPPRNNEQLKARVVEAIEFFNKRAQRRAFRKLYEGIPKRLHKVLKSHGAPTQY